jgi:hypothetical protein
MKRAILLFALISAPAGAQTWSDSGLETANYKYVAVVVEGLSADAGSIGLTKERIRTRVELKLRSAGLTPSNDVNKNNAYLYVNIGVIRNAYNISVEYKRLVDFTTGNLRYQKMATTQNFSNAGMHGNDAAYIMNVLNILLDRFLNEYLKVNQK